LHRAGLPERIEGELAERTGTIIGSGLGGSATLSEQITINATRGPDRISPFFIPMAIANLAAGQAAISFGALGPSWATVSACATAGHAIGEAAETIIRGDADVMIAGGSEAPVCEPLVGAFDAMKALSTRNDDPEGASRPFDEGRDGFVIAEGAGILILEELDHARRRGAEVLAELVGYGATADATHITLPAPGGAGGVRAARRALDKAGMAPAEIDHVSAHATSTPEGDPAELAAFRTVFGDHAPRVSISATKGAIGHTLGAAGGIGAIAAICAMRAGCVPPTLNLTHPSPEMGDLDCTPLKSRSREINAALVNAFGFGGQNAVLIFRRWDDR
jgi:3-oxoacyl-[acyl-carrier-protein] synthase II